MASVYQRGDRDHWYAKIRDPRTLSWRGVRTPFRIDSDAGKRNALMWVAGGEAGAEGALHLGDREARGLLPHDAREFEEFAGVVFAVAEFDGVGEDDIPRLTRAVHGGGLPFGMAVQFAREVGCSVIGDTLAGVLLVEGEELALEGIDIAGRSGVAALAGDDFGDDFAEGVAAAFVAGGIVLARGEGRDVVRGAEALAADHFHAVLGGKGEGKLAMLHDFALGILGRRDCALERIAGEA